MFSARKSKQLLAVAATSLLLLPGLALATCWEEAGRTYNVPVSMLKAIAKVESNMNPGARGKNQNGTYDIGLMQINSSWLSQLKAYKLSEESLRDPCVNLKVGAWILAQNVSQYGWNWEAIGAYNVGCNKLAKAECTKRRNVYVKRIHNALMKPDSKHKASASQALHVAHKAKGLVVYSFEDKDVKVEDSTPQG